MTRFSKKKLLNIKGVFLIFSADLSEIFFIVKRIERECEKRQIGLNVSTRYSCQILMTLYRSRHIFEK